MQNFFENLNNFCLLRCTLFIKIFLRLVSIIVSESHNSCLPKILSNCLISNAAVLERSQSGWSLLSL